MVVRSWGRGGRFAGRGSVAGDGPAQDVLVKEAGEGSRIGRQHRRWDRNRETQQQRDRGQDRARPMQTSNANDGGDASRQPGSAPFRDIRALQQ
jgi:hypothetical protein